jgi:hypothetical protein
MVNYKLQILIKMKTIKILSITIAATFFITSCNLDNLAPIVDVKLPEHKVGIVASGYVENLVPFAFSVSKSQATLQKNADFRVTNPTIQFFENGVLQPGLLQVTDTFSSNNYYAYPTVKGKAGNRYELSVAANGLPTCILKDTMPAEINFSLSKTGKIYYKPSTYNKNVTDTFVEVSIKWQDEGSTKNYYRIMLGSTDTSGLSAVYISYYQEYYSKRPILSKDIVFSDALEQDPLDPNSGETIYPYNSYFTDATFNGKQKEVLISVPVGNFLSDDDYTTLYVKLQHLSRATYLHATSTKKVIESGDIGIFSQPAILYSNAANGYGVLGCCNTSAKSIQLK